MSSVAKSFSGFSGLGVAMKQWIRWWGLIAFVAVIGLFTVFWLFFIDGMVRRLVERTGTAIAGAEVNVSRATVILSPLGLALSGIQVTDPKTPANNSIEIGRVAFSLDGKNLLRRKIVIQEMTADGLRFGTTRKSPGFVVVPEIKKETEKKPSAFTLPAIDVPDVKKILETETLASLKVIEDSKSSVQTMRSDWDKRINELPNKASVDAYRGRLDKIRISSKSGLKELASAAGDAKKIKNDIDRDIDRIKKSRTALAADLSSGKARVAAAEQAPRDDIRRLRDKYSISPAGLKNLSQSLFGDKMTSWLDTGFLWYNRIVPLLESSAAEKGAVKVSKPLRGKGVDVKFPDRMALPDFLIRNVNASLHQETGLFTGTIKNITSDQDILGAPLMFKFDGTGMKDIRFLHLSGVLDHIRPASFKDSINLQTKGYRAVDMVLSGNKDLPVTLKDGLMDIELTGLRTPSGLKATLVGTFTSVHISTGKQEGGGKVLTSLRSVLSRISSFTLSAEISGDPGNYDVKVSSDLDRLFQDAVGRVVQEQSAKLEKELSSAIQAKTDSKLKELKSALGGLTSAESTVDGIQNQLNTLLQEAKQKAEGKTKLRL